MQKISSSTKSPVSNSRYRIYNNNYQAYLPCWMLKDIFKSPNSKPNMPNNQVK